MLHSFHFKKKKKKKSSTTLNFTLLSTEVQIRREKIKKKFSQTLVQRRGGDCWRSAKDSLSLVPLSRGIKAQAPSQEWRSIAKCLWNVEQSVQGRESWERNIVNNYLPAKRKVVSRRGESREVNRGSRDPSNAESSRDPTHVIDFSFLQIFFFLSQFERFAA